ncbi:MAG: shikimate dehydrogenase [Pseudomonadota bacterium]
MTDAGAPARYGVIGHPIGHSLSPMIHTAFAAATDQPMIYEAIDIAPEELDQRLAELAAEGVTGLNVTTPHKSNARKLCKTLSERARTAGAVNTLSFRDDAWHGDTTDGRGLLADLDRLGLLIEGQPVLMVGAGGSAWSVMGDLLDAEPSRVIVANRTVSSGHQLAEHFSDCGRIEGCGLDRIPNRRFALVINATSATLQRARPAIPPGCVRDAHCYDLMYKAGGTVFTDWCFDHGAASVHTGIGMLVEQAALSFEIWRGVAPDTAPVMARLKSELGFRT